MAGLLEFAARFGTEERCIEHLAGLRWPGGFVCAGCGGRQAWRLKARPRVYGSETKLLLNMREDQMPAILNEALEWLDRAEQAREVAGQLTDPSARKAVLELAQNFDRLARAAAAPTAARRRELATKDQ